MAWHADTDFARSLHAEANASWRALESGIEARWQGAEGAMQRWRASEARLGPWRARWAAKATPWKRPGGHPALARHVAQLNLEANGRILAPLCGGSEDLVSLARGGYRVFGVDGCGEARAALAATCRGAKVEPSAVALPDPKNATRIGFLCADFLEATPADVGGAFSACWDQGGLSSVDASDRAAYARALAWHLAPGGRALLVAVEHGPFGDGTTGPPHALSEVDVRALFSAHFDVALLDREDRSGGDPEWTRNRGAGPFVEATYLLVRRAPPPSGP